MDNSTRLPGLPHWTLIISALQHRHKSSSFLQGTCQDLDLAVMAGSNSEGLAHLLFFQFGRLVLELAWNWQDIMQNGFIERGGLLKTKR